MAFAAKSMVVDNQQIEQPAQTNNTPPTTNTAPTPNSNDLDLAELEYIIKALGNLDLKGHQVEMFYRMVLKLQNQYVIKSKN